MSLWLPGAVPPTAPLTWPAADGWIWSWVRTDHPGYRRLGLRSSALTRLQLTSGTYRWDELVAELQARLETIGWGAYLENTGAIVLYADTGEDSVLEYPDRLGWLLGLGREAGTAELGGVASGWRSRFVPPGGIPCVALDWTEVEVSHESELALDRSRRQGGYIWGAARIWRAPVVLTRWAYEALATRWCLRGQVTLWSPRGSSAAMSGANPGGTLTGTILGFEGPPTWKDDPQTMCSATLVIAGTTT